MKVYEKEGIPVTEDVEVAEFSLYQFSKVAEDDEEIFTHVDRIPDAMLRKVSQTHKVLVRYLKTIDQSVSTGVLLDVAAPSKKKKSTKKDVKAPSSQQAQDEDVHIE